MIKSSCDLRPVNLPPWSKLKYFSLMDGREIYGLQRMNHTHVGDPLMFSPPSHQQIDINGFG